MTLFSREELVEALGLLAKELARRGIKSTIQIVGGAALALRHFERASTMDVDGSIRGAAPKEFQDAASTVAARMGWPDDWINDESAKYIPRLGAKQIEWETIFERDGIVIQVAPAEALLAMKLRANRPGRDNGDIAQLMSICALSTVDELEELYSDFYPGDALDDRAIQIVEKVIEVGLPKRPTKPKLPRL
jgi:hypothetical protein